MGYSLRGFRMPRYTFQLKDDDSGGKDDTGVSLLNDENAYRYACDVVRELMRGREPLTRAWQLDVHRDDEEKLFEIFFASLDPTIEHLLPELKETVQQVCRQCRSIKDALYDVRITRREAQALVALSRGKPYLAADRGRKVIRD
jgi:uncharacterized protein DUF6894